jgi:NADH-quinone oxidoreductase subunit G
MENNLSMIVNKNFEYTSLNGTNSLNCDFDINASKNEQEFNKVIESIKKAKAIRFSSTITNEDAHVLQLLKEKLNIKLFNEEARKFQEFMQAYSSVSTNINYSATLDSIKQADVAIVVGSRISSDNQDIKNALESAYKDNNAKIIYAHPMEDASIQNILAQFMKYEVGTEEGVMALLANGILKRAYLSKEERMFFNDLDLGYLGAESNIGEEEIDDMVESFSKAKNCVLVIGNDLMAHPRSQNIAKLAAMIEKYSDFSLLVTPCEVNTIGVSLICDLDKDEDISDVVGYNANGDFTILSLNPQSGSFINMDNDAVTLKVEKEVDCYSLDDIASILDIDAKNSKSSNLRKLFIPSNYNSKLGTGKLEEIDDLPEFNGTIIYQVNQAKKLQEDNLLLGSAQFATAARISDGDKIEISFGFNTITRDFKLDSEMKGTIALNPMFDNVLDASRYKFEKSKIRRVIQ